MSAQKFIKKKAKTAEKKLKPKTIQQKVKPEAEVKEEVVKLPPAKLRICVIGLGAIGGLIAAYLKAKMRDVFVIGRPQQVKIIKSEGLKVEGIKKIVYVALEAKEKLDRKVDLVILAVKTQDIREVISMNRPFIEDTLILTTQNGVRAEKIISLSLGEKNIISSIVMFGASYLKPSLIIHNVEGNWSMGRPFFKNDEKVKDITDELSLAFKTAVVDDIMPMKWTKLFANLSDCIPALLGKSLQETFANLDMAKLSILLLKEGFQVIDKSAVKLTNLPDFDLNKFRELIQMPIEEAAQAFSNIMTNLSKQPLYGLILQSIKRDQASEIDYINGEIINLSRFSGVGAILNTKIVNFVHRVEKTKKFFTVDEIKREFDLDTIK